MDRFIEFISHHPYLVTLFLGIVAALILTELQRGARGISPQELTRLSNGKQARIIDLRDPPDFRGGHITGSENIPYSQINDKAAELAKSDKPLVFVCALGQVAGLAARTLKAAGANEVYRLSGGISGWRQDNLPLVRRK